MNEEEILALSQNLDKLDVGFLPEPIFLSIARITTLTAIEFIALRKTEFGNTEVLLTKRSDRDPTWPGMLHTPGTIIRPTDLSLEDGFKRLFEDEIKIESPIEPVFIGVDLIHHTRGVVTAIQYLLDCTNISTNGTFYDTENLPNTFISEQVPMIRRALTVFNKQ